ncbi:hypothetical protein V492_06108 [Pseudogymnoascus sp. VKM F-4246]|nr:hypothetical protein V492_06108 [Pseudogymnoascus sp. VKM F-4246]
MASGSYESVEMEFWSDWDEDVEIPSPLRIVKRSSTNANTADAVAPSSGAPSSLRVAKRPASTTNTDNFIPKPLRIIKRPNNITKTDAGTNSRTAINIPRRSSSIYNCISISPPDSDSGCLTIRKLRGPRLVVPNQNAYDSSSVEKGHTARETPGGMKVTREVKDPKLNEETKGSIRFL